MHENHDPGREEVEQFDGQRTVSPRLVGFAVLAVATLVFVLQNTDKTKVRFLFFSVNARIWLALVIAVLLGVALDRLLVSWWRRRKSE